jgi:Ca2+ regulator and membrane fusion protein Fig1
VLGFLAILALFRFPRWYTEVSDTGSGQELKPFPSPTLSRTTLTLLLFSTILALLSAMWQHIAAVAAANAIATALGGAISHHIGAASMALAWTAVTMTAITMIALVIMLASINLLERLTNEDE